MKYLINLAIWLLVSLNCAYQTNLNIAIIGGGIGGTSCAYFLKEIFKNSVNIHVYEGNKVGGRLATDLMEDGDEYETGGSIIHERNKYMSDFVHHLGLKKLIPSVNERLGLYNGKDFDFIENNSSIVNLMSIIWQYGYSAKRLKNFVHRMLNKFDRIYQLQAKNQSYETTHDLLKAMDPSFVKYLNISVRDGYLKEGFSESLINELVQASLRVNYGQNINVHEFVGSVSMAGMDGSLWSVKGGNKRVAEKLLKKSKAKLINEYVIQISKNNESYTLLTNSEKTATYDYVVYAAPLTENQKVPITFSNLPLAMKKFGKYHRTVNTLIIGDINRTKFSPLTDDLFTPILIISNNENDFFNSISNVQGLNKKFKLNVWKVFSQNPLSKNQLDELFENINDVKVIDWLAYPHYQVPTASQSFHIADRLYHINAIEWTASAMEMSCIGAKNVALLIKKNVNRLKQNEQDRMEL